MGDIPDVQPGEQVEHEDVIYINPEPYKVHEHTFVEVEPGVFQCTQCPQGRIGAA